MFSSGVLMFSERFTSLLVPGSHVTTSPIKQQVQTSAHFRGSLIVGCCSAGDEVRQVVQHPPMAVPENYKSLSGQELGQPKKMAIVFGHAFKIH